MSDLDHVSSDEATGSYFEDGGGTFGDSFLDGDDDEEGNVEQLHRLADSSCSMKSSSDNGMDEDRGTVQPSDDGHNCGSGRLAVVAEPQSAASSPLEPVTVPDSPPETPAAQTPPESPPPSAQAQTHPSSNSSPPLAVELDSPPKSPTASATVARCSPEHCSIGLSLETDVLDFEDDGPDPPSRASNLSAGKCTEPKDDFAFEVCHQGIVGKGDQHEKNGRDDEEAGVMSDTDSLEEGEVSDDQDKGLSDAPKSVCRFFNKGQCTWGISCRFIHPGVTDKGNYNMFAPVKTHQNSSSVSTSSASASGKLTDSKGDHLETAAPVTEMRKESAWDRAMREAKERLRMASKRRQTDADFEEKKMNLGLAQTEVDRENDYYTRVASPVEPTTADDDLILRKGPDTYDPYEPRRRSSTPSSSLAPPLSPEPYRVGYPPPPPPPRSFPFQQQHQHQYMLCSSGQVRRVPLPPPPPSRSVPEVWGRSGPRGRIAPPHPGLSGRPRGDWQMAARGGGRPGNMFRAASDDRLRDWKQERYEEVIMARRNCDEDFVDPWMRGRSPPPLSSHSRRSCSSGSSLHSRSSRSRSSRSSSSYSSGRSRSMASSASGSAHSTASHRRHKRHYHNRRYGRDSRRHSRSRSSGSRHSSRRRQRTGSSDRRTPPSRSPSPVPVRSRNVGVARSGAGGRQRFPSHTLGAMLVRDGAKGRGSSGAVSSAPSDPSLSASVVGDKGRRAPPPPVDTSRQRSVAPVQLDPAVRRLATATAALEKARQESEASRRSGVGPPSSRSIAATADGVLPSGSSEASRRSAASVAALAAKALQDSARRSLVAAKSLAVPSKSSASVVTAATAKISSNAVHAAKLSSNTSKSGSGASQKSTKRGEAVISPSSATSAALSSSHVLSHRRSVVVNGVDRRQTRRSRSYSSSDSSAPSRSSRSSSSSSSTSGSRSAVGRSRSPSASPNRRKRVSDGRHRFTASRTNVADSRHSSVSMAIVNTNRKSSPVSQQAPADSRTEGLKKRQIKLTLRAPTSVQTSQRVVDSLGGLSGDIAAEKNVPTNRKRAAPSNSDNGSIPDCESFTSQRPNKVAALELPSGGLARSLAGDGDKITEHAVVALRPVSKKPSSSRREELMKQLRAVEDAISKKRTK